jgi:dienelactone hydrolase
MTQTGVCSECVSGFLHEGTPKGEVGTIAKLPTYIAKPANGPSKSGVIVIITDIFGWEFLNNRLLADEYAEKLGRTIYVPDFMNGNTALNQIDKGDTPNGTLIHALNPIDGTHPTFFQKMLRRNYCEALTVERLIPRLSSRWYLGSGSIARA